MSKLLQDTMHVRCYLTISSQEAVRVTKNKPALAYNEIAVGLSLELPRALFDKPQLEARLTIPEGVVPIAEIPLDVQANVAEAIQQATGMAVRMSVLQPDRA